MKLIKGCELTEGEIARLFRLLTPQAATLVAARQIGACLLWAFEDGACAALKGDGREIGFVYVPAGARGQGRGGRLVAAIVGAAGARELVATTSNEAAGAIFEGLGFVEVKVGTWIRRA